MLLVHLLLVSARYHACNFTCTTSAGTATHWVACRSEKCTPRLPEDTCHDGAEPSLEHPSPYGSLLDGPDGCVVAARSLRAVDALRKASTATDTSSSPQPPPLPAPVPGSFAERCEICMGVSRGASSLARHAAAGAPPGAAELCDRAAAEVRALLLPTVRTCRLAPEVCAALLDASRDEACAASVGELRAGGSAGGVLRRQQKECGALAATRRGSGLEAAFCEAPRDVGVRVMIIASMVMAAVFALQCHKAVWLAVWPRTCSS